MYLQRTPRYSGRLFDKVINTETAAVADIPDGASIAVGGFGPVGVPEVLIRAVLEQGATNLETVGNNCGTMVSALKMLLTEHRIRRTTSSYVGPNESSPGNTFPANSKSN